MKPSIGSSERRRPRWFIPAILGAMFAGLLAPQAAHAATVTDKRTIINQQPACAFGEASIERTNTVDQVYNARVRTVAKPTKRIDDMIGPGGVRVCNMASDGSYSLNETVASKMVGWIRVNDDWSPYWQTVGDNGDGWQWRAGKSELFVPWIVQTYLGGNPPVDIAVATAGGHIYVNGGEHEVFTWAGI